MKNAFTFFLLFIILIIVRNLLAQPEVMDSLKIRLPLTNGVEQINTMIFLSEANRGYDFEECILLGKEAVKLADERNDLNLHALATKSVGVSFLYEGDLEHALQYFEKGLNLYNLSNNQQGIANCLNNIGLVFLYRGNYGKAAEFYQKNFDMVKGLNNKPDIASALIQLGNVNYYCGSFQQSLDNYYQAVLIYTDIGDISGQSDAYYSMGVIHSEVKNFEKALEYYRKADSIYRVIQNKRDLSHVLNNMAKIYSFEYKDFKKAKNLYEQSLELKMQLKDNVGIAMTFNNLGTLYGNIGEYIDAMLYFKKSKDLYIEIGSESGLIMVGYNIGELYRESNELQRAVECFMESLERAKKNGEVSYINKNYEALFLTYAQACDYEKFNNFYRLFSIGKDTLIDRLYQSEIIAVEAKFKVKELLIETNSLQKNVEMKQVEIRRYKLFIGGVVLLFVLLLLSFVFYNKKK